MPGGRGCWAAVFTDLLLIAERRAPDKWKEERLDLRWVCEVGALEIVNELEPGGGGRRDESKGEEEQGGGASELLLSWRRPPPYCKLLLRLVWPAHNARAAADACDVFRSLLE